MPSPPHADVDPKQYRRLVKKVRGTACYGALAVHFGTDSPAKLEWRVDRRKPYGDPEDPSKSNKFTHWRNGLWLPWDETCLQVDVRSAGATRLKDWRDLPLWGLLALEPPPLRVLHQYLEQTGMHVRRLLFFDGLPGRDGKFSHSEFDREQILAIRNLRSLDAFQTLVCLARKGELLELDPFHFVPSSCAYELFPRILYSYPQLRYRWETLFQCLERVLWKHQYSTGLRGDFPVEGIRKNLDALLDNPKAEWPCMPRVKRVTPASSSFLA